MFLPRDIRTPLAYPAGRRPGFDPSHVAANKIRCSVVFLPNGPIPIIPAGRMTITGTPPKEIFPIIGPAMNFGAGGATDGADASIAVPISNNSTFAAIVQPSSGATGAKQFLNAYSGGNDGRGISWRNGVLNFEYAFVTTTSSGFGISANVPYFVAASSGPALNFVVVRLDNGSILTSTKSSSTPVATDPTTFQIGNYGATGNNPGAVAAGMWSDFYLSASQMLQWAQRPWEFWYPVK